MSRICPELFTGGHLNKEMENRVVKVFEPNNFVTNVVCNSRYTLLNFVPKNLLEQFRRPLNLYFLLVACLQFISIIAPVSPFSTLLPLLFAFSVTAIKEGYDDLKRHRSDDEYNSRPVTMLRVPSASSLGFSSSSDNNNNNNNAAAAASASAGEWVQTRSEDLRVGDVIQIRHDQEIPCDCLCIAAPSDEVEMPGGTVYIRTENLDGEMDLKPRDVLNAGLTTDTSTVRDVVNACRNFTINYPPPSPNFSNFDGTFFVGQDTQPAFPKHLLLQSAYLKNVRCIYAIVVYTGNETRAGMCKKPAAQKWAALDQCVSRYSILIFICQMIAAFSLGLAGFLMNRDDATWYLALDKGSATERDAGGIIYPLRFFLLTSVMIPISFKFIVDVSKYWMALVLEWDLGMWDDERKEGMRVKNSSIVEDLAQIQYVLSDKTGTLTQNIMSLHSWSTGADALYKMNMPLGAGPTPRNSRTSHVSGKSDPLNSILPSGAFKNSTKTLNETPASNSQHSFRARVPSQREDRANLIELLVAMSITNTVSVNEKYVSGQASPTTGGQQQQRYTAPSPDEECLCASAALQGVTLEHRDKTSMSISVEHTATKRRFTILQVFEFSSDRKCMSIVLREEASTTTNHQQHQQQLSHTSPSAANADDSSMTPTISDHVLSSSSSASSPVVDSTTTTTTASSCSQIWLYSKGADDRILSNLCQVDRDSDRVAQAQLDVTHFAHSGLRTLMFARRKVTVEEYREFDAHISEARVSIHGRQEKIDELQAMFERGVSFLGATGVEDKLQDDVQGTVRRIMDGNVKFWMLTGDKVETAKQIAVSCGLFSSSVIAQNSRNCIDITGANAVEKLRALDARDVQLPAGYAEAQEAARIRLQPLGWFSAAFDPKGDGSCLPLLRSKVLFQSADGRMEAGTVGDNGRATLDTGMFLVIEGGHVLDDIMASEELTVKLFAIATRCVAVVCARVTPGQKAAIANRVKEMDNMTLSIGDGGNDVAMIQESHVGVGILGREGQQAARAADFAIVNFKDLATLMFVHGHMSYMRTSYIVLYSFYKSMLISAIQILYNCFFAKLSGVSFWNSFALTMWNGAFTLPQTICFVLDRCVPREILVRYPLLYRLSQENYGFAPCRFFGWLGAGFLQSSALLACVYLSVGASEVADPSTGQTSSLATDFTASYTCILLLQVPLVLMYSSSITWINALFIAGAPGGYAALMALYSAFKRFDYYKAWGHSETTPYVLFVFITAVILFLPMLLCKQLQTMMAPDASTLLRRMWVSNGRVCTTSERNMQLSDIRTASRPALATTGRSAAEFSVHSTADLEHEKQQSP